MPYLGLKFHPRQIRSGGGTPEKAKEPTIWTPLWLSREILVAFSTLYVACAACLIALYHYAASQNGLPLTVSSSRYSWTYGPTALLTIILSFWRQVDYFHRASKPWQVLMDHQSPASHSVLLDYISPFIGSSFVKAVKLKHAKVAASILAVIILKAIILASTALFSTGLSEYQGFLAVNYTTTFDDSLMWSIYSPQDILATDYNAFYPNNVPVLQYQLSGPVWGYIASVNNATAGNTTEEDQDDWIHQDFTAQATSGNITSVSASVDIFVPKISCESAMVSLGQPLTDEFPADFDDSFIMGDYNIQDINYTLNSDTCTAKNVTASPCDSNQCVNGTSRRYTMHRIYCSSDSDSSGLPVGSDTDIRYAIVTADLENVLGYPDLDVARISRATAVVCKVEYGLEKANMTRTTAGDIIFSNETVRGSTRLLPNTTNEEFSDNLLINIRAAQGSLMVDSRLDYTTTTDVMFQLIVATMDIPENLDILLQPAALTQAVTAIFKGLSKEFARLLLVVPSSSQGLGYGTCSEERLHISLLPLVLIAVFFVVLAILSLLMLCMGRKRHDLYIAGSIASHAAILRNSPSLNIMLEHAGCYAKTDLKDIISGLQFRAENTAAGLSLEVMEDSTGRPQEKQQAQMIYWLPWTARSTAMLITFLLPVAAIVILELLQQLSDQRHGLLNLDASNFTTLSYVVRIAAALSAFIIATMFNNLDFTMAVFSPFSSLRKGGAKAPQALAFNALGMSPFLVFLKSLSVGQFGIVAANSAAFVGSFLAIVASGLWIEFNQVEIQRPATATLYNWDPSWLKNNSHTDDGGAGRALNIIRRAGASRPREIFDDFVAPKVSRPVLSSGENEVPSNMFNYTFEVTVLRPTLKCDVVPPDSITITTEFGSDLSPSVMQMQAEVSSDCVEAPAQGDRSNLNLTSQFMLQPGIQGSFSDLGSLITARGRSDCPSLRVTFSKIDWTNYRANVTSLLCEQGIEEVIANITYQGDPEAGMYDAEHPPVLAPNSTTRWRNSSTGSQTFEYTTGQFISDMRYAPYLLNVRPGADQVDNFFSDMINVTLKVSPDDLAGPDNVENLIQAVTHEYKDYMKMLIDFNFRPHETAWASGLAGYQPNTTTASSVSTITGTAVQRVNRLGIHRPSKIILQALLALMTILGLAARALVRLRGILPRNPCSIASTMAFLAGSRLCDPDSGLIPRRAEFMSKRVLARELDDSAFGLGWWTGPAAAADSSPEDSGKSTPEDDGGGTGLRFGIDVGQPSSLGFSDGGYRRFRKRLRRGDVSAGNNGLAED